MNKAMQWRCFLSNIPKLWISAANQKPKIVITINCTENAM